MMRALVLVLAAAGAVGNTPHSPHAPPADDEPQVGLIVWSDGKSDAESDAAIARWNGLHIQSTQPISKLLSDSVIGLRAGYHITVLGVCPVADSQKIVRLVHSVDRARQSAYVRVVPLSSAIGKLGCPTIQLPKQDWSIDCDDQEHTVTQEVKYAEHGHLLRVEATLTGSCNGELESSQWTATASVEKHGRVLDTKQEWAPNWAQVKALHTDGNSIVLETLDNEGTCASAEMFHMRAIERRFAIKRNKVVKTERVVEESIGLCEPSMEGMNSCEYGPRSARYAAVKDDCTESEAACHKALAAYDQLHAHDDPPDCGDRN